jgi:hypothetical protein
MADWPQTPTKRAAPGPLTLQAFGHLRNVRAAPYLLRAVSCSLGLIACAQSVQVEATPVVRTVVGPTYQVP